MFFFIKCKQYICIHLCYLFTVMIYKYVNFTMCYAEKTDKRSSTLQTTL